MPPTPAPPSRLRRFAVPGVALAVLATAALIFRARLVAWFSGAELDAGVASPGARVTAGSLAIETSIAPDPPRISGNQVRVVVRDAAGAPLDGATVTVTYDMPAMGAMAEMKGSSTAAGEGGGVYRSNLELPGGGSYTLEVAVTSAATSGTARYTLTVGNPGLAVVGARSAAPAAPAAPAPPAAPPTIARFALPAPALTAMTSAFDGYERVRSALAHDRFADIGPAARDVGGALGQADSALASAPAAIRDRVRAAAAAITAIAAAGSLDDTRPAFGELSRALQALAIADPRLASGWHVFECPMAPGYQGWFQRSADLENPYMGARSPTCGGPSTWEGPAATEAASSAPVDATADVITVDPARRQVLGIGTEPVVRAPMSLAVRAVGRLTFDETQLKDVTIRVSGYITKLRVNATGQTVQKGDTLFTYYSPDLYAAQQEALFAWRRATAAPTADPHADPLLHAAETKLRLWGFGDAQLKSLYARNEPLEDIPFPSPAAGVVTEKDVVEGDAIQPGMRLYRIAALDVVWVEADVYEADLPRIKKGQHAAIELTYLPGKTFDGTVAFIYPYLDPASRTGRVRLALANRALDLKPDMYATVAFTIDLGARLQVPKGAVVYTGPRRIVFVDLGDGQLAPRDVTIGAEGTDTVEILAGVAEGDRVVTSGNFLVASESRIRSAAFWERSHVGP
ncbi:MAG: efflux RND transporter periplasmic adaptor subunit [Deltaproteobacteria bacterium]|nr:efflux RND transporter periplasmic adaptor subunit [Deltaproteobacteria bacterium]